uniref:Proline-rich extensin-like protein EPR1-like isoform X3 n=1 Tax=Saccoglossus kowalevskii TaxID=10224 RepID=A0ABM0MI05_SACKO|nr:PREDICTED: proline-rich extensin-like protein EPR1-like isoform X3 [Saccoglossus kowalevskii]
MNSLFSYFLLCLVVLPVIHAVPVRMKPDLTVRDSGINKRSVTEEPVAADLEEVNNNETATEGTVNSDPVNAGLIEDELAELDELSDNPTNGSDIIIADYPPYDSWLIPEDQKFPQRKGHGDVQPHNGNAMGVIRQPGKFVIINPGPENAEPKLPPTDQKSPNGKGYGNVQPHNRNGVGVIRQPGKFVSVNPDPIFIEPTAEYNYPVHHKEQPMGSPSATEESPISWYPGMKQPKVPNQGNIWLTPKDQKFLNGKDHGKVQPHNGDGMGVIRQPGKFRPINPEPVFIEPTPEYNYPVHHKEQPMGSPAATEESPIDWYPGRKQPQVPNQGDIWLTPKDQKSPNGKGHGNVQPHNGNDVGIFRQPGKFLPIKPDPIFIEPTPEYNYPVHHKEQPMGSPAATEESPISWYPGIRQRKVPNQGDIWLTPKDQKSPNGKDHGNVQPHNGDGLDIIHQPKVPYQGDIWLTPKDQTSPNEKDHGNVQPHNGNGIDIIGQPKVPHHGDVLLKPKDQQFPNTKGYDNIQPHTGQDVGVIRQSNESDIIILNPNSTEPTQEDYSEQHKQEPIQSPMANGEHLNALNPGKMQPKVPHINAPPNGNPHSNVQPHGVGVVLQSNESDIIILNPNSTEPTQEDYVSEQHIKQPILSPMATGENSNALHPGRKQPKVPHINIPPNGNPHSNVQPHTENGVGIVRQSNESDIIILDPVFIEPTPEYYYPEQHGKQPIGSPVATEESPIAWQPGRDEPKAPNNKSPNEEDPRNVQPHNGNDMGVMVN